MREAGNTAITEGHTAHLPVGKVSDARGEIAHRAIVNANSHCAPKIIQCVGDYMAIGVSHRTQMIACIVAVTKSVVAAVIIELLLREIVVQVITVGPSRNNGTWVIVITVIQI